MKKQKMIAILQLLIFFNILCCNTKKLESYCETVKTINFEEGNICYPKIISYHFGIEDLKISEQIETLSGLQMDGMITQIEGDNLHKLDSYYKDCLVKNGTFNIYNIFTTISINNPKECSGQLAIIKRIYEKIQYQNTELLVLFDGAKDDSNLTITISKLAEIAQEYNKTLIIYPHEGLAIETAEEALTFIQNGNKSNIFLSVHLCHELAAGNGNRMEEVVNNVSPYIKFVSISGATLSEKSNKSLPEWYWGIKPLNMGNYNYNPFYKALFNANYEGPVALQTWGICHNFNLNVQDHLSMSKSIINKMSENLCD